MSANTATLQMSNILIIFGSPHNNGYTAKLLDSFLTALPKNVTIDRINAFGCNIYPCNDCGYCKEADRCVNKDFDEFDRLYRNADVVVIATPVYNLSVPAPLKCILDRTQQYFNARFSRNIKPVIEKNKKALILITSGSDDIYGPEVIKRTLAQMFTVMNTEIIAEAVWKATDNTPEKYRVSAFKDAELAAEILSKY